MTMQESSALYSGLKLVILSSGENAGLENRIRGFPIVDMDDDCIGLLHTNEVRELLSEKYFTNARGSTNLQSGR